MADRIVETPPTRLKSIPEDVRLGIYSEVESKSALGLAWAEKIRRFCSISGRNLQSTAEKRFGSEAKTHLAWMADILILASEYSESGAPVDQAMLSAALYCLDSIPSGPQQKADNLCDGLEKWLKNTAPIDLPTEALGEFYSGNSCEWLQETEAEGVVILCPTPYSLISLSVYSILKKLDIKISTIIIRSFTISRIKHEWNRDGFRLIQKIWRKLILRADESPEQTDISLKSVCDRLDLEHSDIRQWAKCDNVPVLNVSEFDDATSSLQEFGPVIAIFTGGGMIGQELLDQFPKGIVNVHHGLLPQHKGMDVVHAPILEGHFDSVGFTAHLMEKRLDQGPVLSHFRMESSEQSSIGALRNELQAITPFLAVDATLGRLSGRISPVIQPEAGRQYYFVHPRLTKILNSVLNHRYSPSSVSKLKSAVETSFRGLSSKC